MEFKVGDVVEWCGIRGKVESIGNFIIVSFRVENNKGNLPQYAFTKDGKYISYLSQETLTKELSNNIANNREFKPRAILRKKPTS